MSFWRTLMGRKYLSTKTRPGEAIDANQISDVVGIVLLLACDCAKGIRPKKSPRRNCRAVIERMLSDNAAGNRHQRDSIKQMRARASGHACAIAQTGLAKRALRDNTKLASCGSNRAAKRPRESRLRGAGGRDSRSCSLLPIMASMSYGAKSRLRGAGARVRGVVPCGRSWR